MKKKDDENYEIIPNIDVYKISIIKGKKYKYVLDEKKLCRCTKEFEHSNLSKGNNFLYMFSGYESSSDKKIRDNWNASSSDKKTTENWNVSNGNNISNIFDEII